MDDLKGKSKGKSTKGKDVVVDKENLPPSDDDNVPSSDDFISEGSSFAFKRPGGNKAAKNDAKKQKTDENSMRISAQAQMEMVAANTRRIQILEDHALQNLFSMKADDIDADCQQFFKLCCVEELAKLTKRQNTGGAEKERVAPTNSPAPARNPDSTLEDPSDLLQTLEFATIEVKEEIDPNEVVDDDNSLVAE